MDSHSELVLQNGFLPNGLLPKGASSVTRPLDPVRWAIAEERTAELISRIQPNWTAEKHRNAVASYVQRLIGKCVPCEVFTFGSVPLRTYLPDGDIDLTAFSEDHNVKDYWAKSVLEILRSEEKNECAEFQVKEVQYIQAEVKIIKCLVDNIVVDISFNQLGGLCTLCFLEEVDNLISQNHLFKRSIILIKAWCYYESRILGAHHGLISTYALETLVLYIFHVFNNSFAGPLEVLYRFVEFFSKFDWANFCVSLWGPVPICSLPIMAADPPRKDGEELLLNKMFLNACSTAYSVFPPRRHDNQEQPFVSKHFNVVDPLRRNNNLGRSVSKGNFYRIRSAFSFGAQQLAKILECEQENIVDEVNQFFVNTWDRHGKGCRPDAPMPKSLHIRQVDSEHDGNCRNNELAETATQNFTSQCPQIDESHNSIELLMQRSSFPVNPMASAINVNKDLHTPLRKDCDEESKTKMDSGWDQYYTQKMNPTRKQLSEKERIFRANILQNRRHATPQFARTSSSPELTSMSSEAVSLRRHNAPKARVKEVTSSRSEYNRRTRDSDTMESHVINCFTDVPFTNENSSSGGNASKPVTSSTKSVVHSGDLPSQRHQLGQDFMNMHMPVNLASYPFVSISPSIPGYRPKNFSGAPVAPFQQSNPVGAIPDSETTRAINREPASLEVERMNDGHGLWTDCNADDSMKDVDHESENFSAASSRLSPASSANSYGTKGSSESSWDGKPSKINDAVRYSLTKTSSSSKKPTATVNGRQLDIGPVDCIYDDVNDKPAVPSVTSLRGEANMLPGFGQAHMRYPNSMLPFAPLLVPPGSQQGVNHAVLPIAFYPAGPPVPFVTVVPVGNINAETVASGVPASHDDAEMEKSTFPVGQSSPSSHSAKELEKLNYSNSFGSTKRNAVRGQSNECELDIFNSDFANHWKNLQYGRLCQNSQLQHPAAPSVFVPHPHLQGNTPYPRSPNVVAHPVPLSVQQPVPSESAVVSRQYGELPKHRNGTGTYFPNPEVLRDRQFVTSKQHQVDSKHGRNEYHGEREENWNFSSKPRFAGRVHPRYRNDKRNSKIDRSVASSSQTYRPCDTFRKNSHQLYNFPKDPSTPKSTWNEHYDADHLVYQTCLEYPDEFGSVGPESCLGADKVQVFRGYPEGSDLEHQNFHGDTESPPDYACPPRFLRSDRV